MTAICLAAAVAVATRPAVAAENVIRDTEIEADIRTMVTPVWRAAGLEPSALHVYLIEDKQLNSFVAGGQNEFINTGLLMRVETPNQLIGVLAHETGHIAGGHLTRVQEAMRNASIEGIIAMVLGAAASVAGGSGAALLGAAGVAQRSLMQYSVTQEASADQAALTFLDRSGQSARGLLKFLEILQGEELLSGERQDPYLRTHPLTSARIEYVRNHVEHSRFSNVPDTPGNIELLKRIKAKLGAFTSPPSATLAAYPEQDQSVLARYARAIAYYRIPKLDKALPIIDGLIRDYPKDPYFRELKGQMLFENGRIAEARQPYEDAVRLAPAAPLLRISLAQVYVESNDPKLNKRAIAYLNDALRTEDKETTAWHLLATAYGRDNQLGMAALALAEEGLSAGKKKDATQQAVRAKALLLKNSAAYSRAEEVQREAEKMEDSE
ncbi:MAG: M48 family metallopeptidase [Alphaproteobacteria bacterium]|nr:M48 family metallopeptidase [Alphaproteobacteria bacterium]